MCHRGRAALVDGQTRRSAHAAERPSILPRRGAKMLAEVVAQVRGGAHPGAVCDRFHREPARFQQALCGAWSVET